VSPGTEDSLTMDSVETNVPGPTTTLVDMIEPTKGFDLLKAIRNRCGKDPFFAKILEQPKAYKNFNVSNTQGVIYLLDNGRRLLCIPAIHINGRSMQEIVISNAHLILAHLGTTRTLAYLKELVWWRSMVLDMATFINSCSTCC
jgi:hypothetical protein